jgi:hypothetical protein
MKTAYELAMERLGKSSPTVRLSGEQKKALAELESVYRARIAEREISLEAEAEAAAAAGEVEKMEQARQQLARERQRLQAELEEKKDRVRQEQR